MESIILNTLDYPILTVTTFLPLAGSFVILLLRREAIVKWFALATTISTFVVSLPIYKHFDKETYKMQFAEIYPWIPTWNIHYKVGVDGISVLFIMLVAILSILCVTVSWKAIQTKTKEFFISLLIMETAMIGIFISLNVFLFYLFWELTLIPMFFLIGVWGGSKRVYAAIKFVLFMLAGSVFMLVGIIVLYYEGGRTFDMLELSKVIYPTGLQLWLFLAFFAAFAVKMPMFPIHTWLPDAHTEAPTAGSVILAGVMLKMGAYGFLRFSLPMFPHAVKVLFIPLLILSVTAIIYGAYVTLMQKDMKRLIAYSSVSHMGFVTLGLFTLNQTGVEGGLLQMINHGVITGALFLCIGMIYERTHTRMIEDYGGLSKTVPIYIVFFTIFTLAAIGLPGMNAFVGEFLIISGAFKANMIIAAFSIFGVVLGVTYMVWLYYRVALNEINSSSQSHLFDLDWREIATLVPLVVLVFLIGVQPGILLSYMHVSVEHLLEQVHTVVPLETFNINHSINLVAEYVKELLWWV
ncbi:MAG TPA: NADH-quinone oxidoreductase subunit M [Candidatus Marinimicrobia bacterium]|jgi:NADH-quinone oxidoreductase subunit M|nr:NADH-quinone oxidoreductase subunit M [Candidatus Neomarinimicrobiota bacterium]HIB02566.1 NADH-quinone oxidoreductase subunit M [Candidatus Neomarinimicrobiota bacterium]HIB95321.1 NADH-quinone oxidoreductase subunit M [Candidatus Neomarinimicrobiota bacterium]HIN62158.1 NADH-quinone oxidoreductase subunit M [Candidatus Neomarinimicrobiota bacterium]HIO55442.1 NADH-quinone oxidoreductase subunit M [Candidatus Neomarinimicrobiota bacterium]